MTDTVLEIRGLRKVYRGFTLGDVDLDVPRGFVTGLIGPNGAGKTTIIKLIMNLVRRDAGSVRVFGLDNLRDEAAVRSRIGFVYDEPPFFHDISLRDNARAIAPFYPAWSDQRFRQLAGRFGLPLGKRFKALSHGMKMKFALAVALSHDADLLLMDEPTSGLDLAFRRELLDELRDILRDDRKSVLFSTHVTSDLDRIADFVTFIQSGAVVFTLPADALRDSWCIVKGGDEALARLAPAIVKGIRRGPYGVEALVSDATAARHQLGADAAFDRATLDDILVFMGRGDSHAHAA